MQETPGPAAADDDRRRIDAALAAVDAVWAAYEAGSPEFFDLFTADATIFSLSSPLRLEGREAYRRAFGAQFLEQRRRTQVLHAEVRLVGEGALVTYHGRVRVQSTSVDSRTTLLLLPEHGRLKIAHMHMSPLDSPPAAAAAGLQEEVALAWTREEGS